jgi:hypothetical protein
MIRRLKKLNIMQKAVLIILLFILFCQFAGSTLAWYQSSEERNNHFGVKDSYVDVVLTETNWDSVGRQQALAMQPGMDIFKNPVVVNTSGDWCFVRMKLDILDNDGNEITDEERKTAILSALKYTDGEDILTTNKDENYSTGASLNSDFIENGGWYYYAPGEVCTAIAPAQETTALFTDVLIPCLKSNYQYFEDGFKIVVYAEAVYTNEGATTLDSVETLAQHFATVESNVTNGVDENNTSLSAYSLFGLDEATSDKAVKDAATSVGAFVEKN